MIFVLSWLLIRVKTLSEEIILESHNNYKHKYMREKQLVKYTYGFIYTESVIKKSAGILRGKKVKCHCFSDSTLKLKL